MADLTFDPVLETRYVDEKLIFLAILQNLNYHLHSSLFLSWKSFDKMSTIYVQYINGNLKISINIKAIYHSLKKILPEKNRQINEDNFDKKNVFGVRCVHASSEKEIKNKQ